MCSGASVMWIDVWSGREVGCGAAPAAGGREDGRDVGDEGRGAALGTAGTAAMSRDAEPAAEHPPAADGGRRGKW